MRHDAPPRAMAYSLSSLFFVVTLAAILTPVLTCVWQEPIDGKELITVAVGIGLAGSFFGAVVGLYHHRRWRGLAVGVIMGGCVGVCIGPTLLIKDLDRIVTVCLLSSLVLVLVSAFWGSVSWRKGSRE
jgi:uncharacterized membrane protein YfcA